MKGTYGRVDYRLRLKVWDVIGYARKTQGGIKEIKIGRASTREAAYTMLQSWYHDTPKRSMAYA